MLFFVLHYGILWFNDSLAETFIFCDLIIGFLPLADVVGGVHEILWVVEIVLDKVVPEEVDLNRAGEME
jgi:hypothetical protein